MAPKHSEDPSRTAVAAPSFPSPAHDPEYRAAFGVWDGEPSSSPEEQGFEPRRIERAYAGRTDELGRGLHRRAVARLRDAGGEGAVNVADPDPGAPPAADAQWRVEVDPWPSPDSDPIYRAAFGTRASEAGDAHVEWLAEVRRIAHDYATRQDDVGRRLYLRAVAALHEAGETLDEGEAPVQAAG